MNDIETEKMISIYNHKVNKILEKVKVELENKEEYGCLEKCLDQDNPEKYM